VIAESMAFDHAKHQADGYDHNQADEYDYNQASYCKASEVSEQEVNSVGDLEAWDFFCEVSHREAHEVMHTALAESVSTTAWTTKAAAASEQDIDEATSVADLDDDIPDDRLPLVDDSYRDMAGGVASIKGASCIRRDKSFTEEERCPRKTPSDIEVLSNASTVTPVATDRTESPARCETVSGLTCWESGPQHPEASLELPVVPLEPHVKVVGDGRDAPLVAAALPLPPLDRNFEEPCVAVMLNGALTPEEFVPSAAALFGCPIAQPKRPRRKPWPTIGGRGYSSNRTGQSMGTWV